jgi:signal transduction histidine kinase
MVAKSQIIPSLSLFKLKNLIQKVYVELEKQNLDYKRILVNWEMPVSDVYTDPMLIRQILVNLCSNALKFSNKDVELFFKTTNQELTIKIQDFGIGIPDVETELVFNPFHRAPNGKRVPGYGLGLAIVGSVTEYLGGKVYLASTVNQGTTIKIIIPCETSPTETRNIIL